MDPNPIRKVLSTLRSHSVKFLLMGGQACVFYGGAEFSRDADIALLADEEILARLNDALTDLEAKCIAVPPLSLDVLRRGHGVHFRCHRSDVAGIRIDAMSVMRGVAPFSVLWDRRTTIETDDGEAVDLMALPDLVTAKKTRRDKDWPMIRRLIEAHYVENQDSPSAAQIDFWLEECRSPSLLLTLAQTHPDAAAASRRAAVRAAVDDDQEGIVKALADEEQAEREADDAYWRPLMKELEAMRHAKS